MELMTRLPVVVRVGLAQLGQSLDGRKSSNQTCGYAEPQRDDLARRRDGRLAGVALVAPEAPTLTWRSSIAT
jgi:hypothetical protein